MSVFMSDFHACILTIRFAGMGNLLKVLTREIENYPHFFLDFESKSGRGVELKEKRWMEEDVCARVCVCVGGCPFLQQVSDPDDEALKDFTLARFFLALSWFLFYRWVMTPPALVCLITH